MIAGAIILAAGRSTRMGDAHKLLAVWRDRPLVVHVADAVADAGLPPPVIVLGHRADDVRAALGGHAAHFVVAPDFADGLSASLRAGLAAAPAEWDAALICLGDMPRVGTATLRALAAVASPMVVAVPVWAGRRGNPVLWGRAHFGALAAQTGDTGGKALLAGRRVVEVMADSNGVLIDVDTVEALALLGN